MIYLDILNVREHRKSCHINFLQECFRLRNSFTRDRNSEDGDHAENRFHYFLCLNVLFFNVDCFVLQGQDVLKIECELI